MIGWIEGKRLGCCVKVILGISVLLVWMGDIAFGFRNF